MGDRGNIIIEADGQTFPAPVYLYTHWSGSDIPKLLKAALIKGVSRWDDPAYLARIIFQTLIGGDKGETGFGLSTSMVADGTEYHVNMEARTVRNPHGQTASFEEFTE
jgi:hypothetical protein